MFLETVDIAVNPEKTLLGLNAIVDKMNSLQSIAVKVSAAFAGIMITRKIYNSMNNAEASIIKLKTALQDATKGVQDYEKAMTFAAKTPFPVESVISASVALRAFQLDPFKEVTKGGRELLTVLGDMAGAMGQDLTTATLALTRAGQGEWEIMDNNFQINARMIPKLAGLTAGTQKYREEIIKFVSEQKRFQGGMEAMANSMAGMMSNLADAFDLITMGIGGVSDAEGRLKGLTLYDSVKQSIRELYEVVSNDSIFNTMNEQVDKFDAMNIKIQKFGKSLNGDLKKGFEEAQRNILKLDISRPVNSLDVSLEYLYKNNAKGKFKPIIDELEKMYDSTVSMEKKMAQSPEMLAKMQRQVIWKANTKTGRNRDEKLNELVGKTKDSALQVQMINDFTTQGEKILYFGRLIGQVFKVIYDTIVIPFVGGIAYLIESVLDKGSKVLNLIIPVNSFGASVTQTMQGVQDNLKSTFMQFTNDMFVTEKELTALSSIYLHNSTKRDRDAIEQRFLSSKNILEKQMVVLAILLQIFSILVRERMKKIMEWFGPIIDAVQYSMGKIWSGVIVLLKAVWEAGKRLWEGFSQWLGDIRHNTVLLIRSFGDLFSRNSEITAFITEIMGPAFQALGWVLGLVANSFLQFTHFTMTVWNKLALLRPLLGLIWTAVKVLIGVWFGWKTAIFAVGLIGVPVITAITFAMKGLAAGTLLTTQGLGGLVGQLKGSTGASKALGEAFGAMQDVYKHFATQGFKNLSTAFGWMLVVAVAIGAAMWVWENYSEEIKATFSVIWDTVKDIWNGIIEIGKSIAFALVDLYKFLEQKKLLGGIVALIVIGLASYALYIGMATAATDGFAAGMLAILKSLTKIPIIGGMLTAIFAKLSVIGAFLSGLGGGMIAPILAAIGFVVTFREIFLGALYAIWEAVAPIGDAFMDIFSMFSTNNDQPFGDLDSVEFSFESILNVVKEVWEWIRGFKEEFFLIGRVIGSLVMVGITPMVQLFRAFALTIKTVFQLFKGLWDMIRHGKTASEAFGGVWETVRKLFYTMVKAVWEIIKPIYGIISMIIPGGKGFVAMDAFDKKLSDETGEKFKEKTETAISEKTKDFKQRREDTKYERMTTDEKQIELTRLTDVNEKLQLSMNELSARLVDKKLTGEERNSLQAKYQLKATALTRNTEEIAKIKGVEKIEADKIILNTKDKIVPGQDVTKRFEGMLPKGLAGMDLASTDVPDSPLVNQPAFQMAKGDQKAILDKFSESYKKENEILRMYYTKLSESDTRANKKNTDDLITEIRQLKVAVSDINYKVFFKESDGGFTPVKPKYAVGAYDIKEDHIAEIHKGEMIIDAAHAQAIRGGQTRGSIIPQLGDGRVESRKENKIYITQNFYTNDAKKTASELKSIMQNLSMDLSLKI